MHYNQANSFQPKRRQLGPAGLTNARLEWDPALPTHIRTDAPELRLTLINQIHPGHARFARLVGDLVRTHELGWLITLFEDGRKEKANG